MSHSVISNNKMIILPIVACEVKNLIFNRKWICGPSQKTRICGPSQKTRICGPSQKNKIWRFTEKWR